MCIWPAEQCPVHHKKKRIHLHLCFIADDKEEISEALKVLLSWQDDAPGAGAAAAEEDEAFDASGGVTVAPLEARHEVRVDKAMALWAQAACGHVVVRDASTPPSP